MVLTGIGMGLLLVGGNREPAVLGLLLICLCVLVSNLVIILRIKRAEPRRN